MDEEDEGSREVEDEQMSRWKITRRRKMKTRRRKMSRMPPWHSQRRKMRRKMRRRKMPPWHSQRGNKGSHYLSSDRKPTMQRSTKLSLLNASLQNGRSETYLAHQGQGYFLQYFRSHIQTGATATSEECQQFLRENPLNRSWKQIQDRVKTLWGHYLKDGRLWHWYIAFLYCFCFSTQQLLHFTWYSLHDNNVDPFHILFGSSLWSIHKSLIQLASQSQTH